MVLISIDTLRSDRLPAYGYKGVETPAIDALRRDSVLFERAYSHYPMTLPSHVSILTGQLPTRHKVRDNVGYEFKAAGHPYLPRLFHEAGYATGGAVSTYVLRGATGLSEGFDFYEDDLEHAPDEPLGAGQRPGDVTARLALDWIRQRAERPFFFFFHIYEPHTPYAPVAPFDARYKDKYDGEVATADAVVGNFLAELKRLGVYERAVVVLLSDHGEGLGDHGEKQHGIFLYRESIQVPLMVKLPGGKRAGETVRRPVALADVAPTVAAGAGLEAPEGFDGRSLLVQGGEEEERAIYSETFYPRLHLGWSDLSSLVGARFHYIHGPDPELYDVVADPRETVNVRARERRAFSSLREEIGGYDRQLAPPEEADAETARKLAALGYLGGPSVYRAGSDLPDPKTQKHVLAEVEAAFDHFGQQRFAEAVPVFTRLVESNPEMLDMWSFLGISLNRLGRNEEAARAFDRALDLSEGSTQLAVAAASAWLEAGHPEEAGKRLDLAADADPRTVDELKAQIAVARHDMPAALSLMSRVIETGEASDAMRRQYALTLAQAGRAEEALAVLAPLADKGAAADLNAMAVVQMNAGRLAEARRTLERALAAYPSNPRVHELLGEVELRAGRPREAVVHLRRALALSDRLATAWNTLGAALYQTEGPAAALDAWERALALDPTQYNALFNMGLVAAEAGRPAQARQALRRFVDTAPPARFGPDVEKARGLLRQLGG